MDMLDVSVTLIVKAPNQQIEDQTIKCDTTWSIRKLKGYLEEVYPSKPRTEDQKLIYSGQLLPDTVILKDVLRQYEGQETHTVHLVCTASRDSMKRPVPVSTRPPPRMSETRPESTTTVPNDESSQSATTSDTLDGIRQRLSAANVPPPSVSHQYNAGYPASDQRAMWTAAMAQPYPGGYDPNQMAQQLMYMQQAYAQYMTNYMQMMAANTGAPPMPGSLPPPTQPVPEPPADNAREQPDPQPDENPNILDGEEEEGRGNRDWLDWFYILSRVMVLFSIVYFYSSPTRFIIVSALGVMMYLYQVGFFRAQAQMLPGGQDVADNNNHAGGARGVDNHNLRNNQEAGEADEESDHDETTDTDTGNEVCSSIVLCALVGQSYSAPAPQFEPTFNIPFENMLGNTKPQTQIYRIAFRPDDGMKNRVRFEEKHGPRGERLIASFGSGAAPGPASFLDDHVINRNNQAVKAKKRHQNYSTTISYETSTKN